MSPLKVLHLASFSGNIGDNANHMGFRPWFAERLGRPVDWTELEIREFFWKERAFDADFANLANSYDALIIGGGNYFELWVEGSPTGTSIATPPEVFDRITVPVYFNALGVDPGQGVPDSSRRNFTAFLDKLLASDQYLVTVRNDGAVDALQTHIGADYAAAVHHVPDSGFFAPISTDDAPDILNADARYIGINVANDMADVRFAKFNASEGSVAFAAEFAAALTRLSEDHGDVHFILFPHIFRDVEVIFQVLDKMGDRLRRKRVIVAPYGSGDAAARVALGLYKQCEMVLGMRFHANVCAMGAGRPTLGLVCYRQIAMLYAELGHGDATVDVSAPGFAQVLRDRVNGVLADLPAHEARVQDARRKVTQMRTGFEPALQDWFTANGLGRRT
ncbi:polysaccharide pyruvyl transferase family protein [uncultured Sulfitobacter sp.]|uniref:polysaccharide pyruvyl transferase family protein n=1 Tax=uncultured Sulfitobacter sp. TaxID=191468 RepID=UPI0030FA2A1C